MRPERGKFVKPGQKERLATEENCGAVIISSCAETPTEKLGAINLAQLDRYTGTSTG
jgi:hypothetical protein